MDRWFRNLNNFIYLGLEKIGIEKGAIGIAIIIFTLITRLILYPFTVQQQKSSKLMAIIQPEIKLIQAKTKMYIIFPSSLKGKKRYDITYPVTEEMRLNIFNAIFNYFWISLVLMLTVCLCWLFFRQGLYNFMSHFYEISFKSLFLSFLIANPAVFLILSSVPLCFNKTGESMVQDML